MSSHDRRTKSLAWLIIGASSVSFALFLYTNLFKLNLQWDEGWSLAVAVNYLHDHTYGIRVLDQPYPGSFSGSFFVVWLAKFGVTAFGPAVVAARSAFVLLAIIVYFCLFALFRRIHGLLTAALALSFITCLSGTVDSNLGFEGAQILGEMPVIFCFVCAALIASFLPDAWKIIYCCPLYMAALLLKAQVLPLAIAACLALVFFELYRRRFREACVLAVTVGAAFGLKDHASALFSTMLFPHASYPAITDPLRKITEADATFSMRSIAWNPAFGMRWSIISNFVFLRPLFAVGLVCALMRRDAFSDAESGDRSTVFYRYLVCFGLCWLAWALCLSIGWGRYLFIPIVLLSGCTAKGLTSAIRILDSNGASIPRPMLRAAQIIFGVLLSVCIVSSMFQHYVMLTYENQQQFLTSTTNFINTSVGEHAIIETDEAELFPYIKRSLHFPLERLHSHWDTRDFAGGNEAVEPVTIPADTAFIVTGPYATTHKIYANLIEKDRLTPIFSAGPYKVFSYSNARK